jgi:hypothetical protein
VLDNGDMLVMLGDDASLLVSQGAVVLISPKSPEPLVPLYADPKLFKTISDDIADQDRTAGVEIGARRDWLSWTGWTSFMFPVIRQDEQELANLRDLRSRLAKATVRLGKPSSITPAADLLPQGSVQLFVGGHLLPDGQVGFILPDGKLATTDGKTIRMPGQKEDQVSPLLTKTLVSIMGRLVKELDGDIKASDNDLANLKTEHLSIQKDLQEYQSIQAENSYDPDYEVDYGTESIPVGQAISRTQQDLRDNENDAAQTLAERNKDAADFARVTAALQTFGK